jgi:hypothetical protein
MVTVWPGGNEFNSRLTDLEKVVDCYLQDGKGRTRWNDIV